MPILEKGPENGRNIFSTSNITLPLVQAQDIPQTFQMFWYSSNIKTFLLNGSQCPPTSAFDSGFNVNLCQLSALSAAQSAAQLSHCFPRATTGGLVLGTVLPKSFTSDVQRCAKSCAKRCANGDVPRMCQVASTHNPPVFRMAPPPRQNHIPNSPMNGFLTTRRTMSNSNVEQAGKHYILLNKQPN